MIILLTGCINPNGMAFTTLSNQEDRKTQYIEAIRYYLSSTNYPIVFTENSGTDISYLFSSAIQSGRMEFLTFWGNQNKKRGKGYGECEIIQYALDNSRLINYDQKKVIAKITGRLIVKNLKTITRLNTLLLSKQTVFCAINSDLSFPDSRFIIAPFSFYKSFLQSMNKINDSNGYYFEHALCDKLKDDKSISFSPFFLKPQIEGMSGSTGLLYTNNPNTLAFAYRYAKYTFLLKRKFNKLYRSR